MTFSNNDPIVRCFGCKTNVRISVTMEIPTGRHGDLERWCGTCISEVDQISEEMLPRETGEPTLNDIESFGNLQLDAIDPLEDE